MQGAYEIYFLLSAHFPFQIYRPEHVCRPRQDGMSDKYTSRHVAAHPSPLPRQQRILLTLYIPFTPYQSPLLPPKNLNPRLNICKLLLHPTPRRPIWRAKHKLSFETPVGWQTPLRVDFLRHALLVMLQITAEAFGAECGPG